MEFLLAASLPDDFRASPRGRFTALEGGMKKRLALGDQDGEAGHRVEPNALRF